MVNSNLRQALGVLLLLGSGCASGPQSHGAKEVPRTVVEEEARSSGDNAGPAQAADVVSTLLRSGESLDGVAWVAVAPTSDPESPRNMLVASRVESGHPGVFHYRIDSFERSNGELKSLGFEYVQGYELGVALLSTEDIDGDGVGDPLAKWDLGIAVLPSRTKELAVLILEEEKEILSVCWALHDGALTLVYTAAFETDGAGCFGQRQVSSGTTQFHYGLEQQGTRAARKGTVAHASDGPPYGRCRDGQILLLPLPASETSAVRLMKLVGPRQGPEEFDPHGPPPC
jgi:hypothetical protein